MRKCLRSWVLSALVAAFFVVSSPAPLTAQACWGYCESPGMGECYNICNFGYTYLGVGYISGCGQCDFWYCEYVSECLFGGGCNCTCASDVWADNCGIPV
jgi:hypothetical protein